MKVGEIGWIDLTVADAESVRDFYARVAGWKHDPVDMGDYADFTMQAEDGTAVGGICHARGTNAGLPAQWLIYINVADIEASARACVEGGGTLLVEPKSMGTHGRYCVIRDPAGAVAALWQKMD
jgi:uncharacterized protein